MDHETVIVKKKSLSTLAIVKNYGVSDVAIKKWAKRYNLSFPPRGYWAKFAAGNLAECKVIKDKMVG